MDISKKLNRDFYIKMRIKGYEHNALVNSTFPPERKEKFQSDVADLESIDFSKRVDVEKLVNSGETKKEVATKKAATKKTKTK